MEPREWKAKAIAIASRVYKVLLTAYPKDLRYEHGAEMVRLFRDLSRSELKRSGTVGLFSLWLRTFVEFVGTAVGERTRKGTSMFSTNVFSYRGVVRLGGIVAMSAGILFIFLWYFTANMNTDLTGPGSNFRATLWIARFGLIILFITALLTLYLRILRESDGGRVAKRLATVALAPLLVAVVTFFIGLASDEFFVSFVLQSWALLIATGLMVVSSILAGVMGRGALFSPLLISLSVPPFDLLMQSFGEFVYSVTVEPIYLALSPQVRNQTGLPNPFLSQIDIFFTNLLWFGLPIVLTGIGWILLGRMIRNSVSENRDDSSPGLEELQQLHSAGVLTDDEFDNAKLRLTDQ